MTVEQVMSDLKSNSNPSRKKTLLKAGASENTYGVLLGYLRSYAKKIGVNHELAFKLMYTLNTDAMLLAVMLFDVSKLSAKEAYDVLSIITLEQVLDDFMFRVVTLIEEVDVLYDMLKDNESDMIKRALWAINVERVRHKSIDDNEVLYLLEVIKRNLVNETPKAQWMMNYCFAQIGITYEKYRTKVLDLSEKLGVYKDMKVAPGCTSAYVPNWIHAVIK